VDAIAKGLAYIKSTEWYLKQSSADQNRLNSEYPKHLASEYSNKANLSTSTSGDMEVPEGEKERKTSTTLRKNAASTGQISAAQIAREKPQFYTQRSFAEGLEDGIAYVDELGGPAAAYAKLMESPKIEDAPKTLVARMIVLDYLGRVYADPNSTQAQKEAAGASIQGIEEVLGRDNTAAGRSIVYWKMYQVLGPSGVLNHLKWKIKKANDLELQKESGGVKIADQIKQLQDEVKAISAELGQAILDKKELQDLITNIVSNNVPKTGKYKQKANEETKIRAAARDKFKKSGASLTLSSGGFTNEAIEYVGELAASLVRQGIYEIADVVQRVVAQIKVDTDQTVSIKSVRDVVESSITKQIATAVSKKELTAKKINDIIKEHWDNRATATTKLADRLVSEAGITSEDAKLVQAEVERIINDLVAKRAEKALERIASLKVRDKVSKKSTADKMADMIKLGILDNEKYDGLFEQMFGLHTLTEEQEARIKELTSVVQNVEGYGIISNRALIDLSKYVTEVMPESRVEKYARLFIAINYANMLSGLSTHALNMFSTGTNFVTMVPRTILNMSRWYAYFRGKAGRSGDIKSNPIAELLYQTRSISTGLFYGSKEFMDAFTNGSSDPKYIEDIVGRDKLRMGALERTSTPKAVKALKYVGRLLAAEDKLMWNTAYEMQIMTIIHDKMVNKGLTGQALETAIMDEYLGRHLDQNQLNATLEKEIEAYEAGGNTLTRNQVAIRRRQLMLDMSNITYEEQEVASKMAKSNIFTDDRAGVIAHIASAIGSVANKSIGTKLATMPFVPFTKVVGNVAEYMLDHTPIYGLMRANGISISGAVKKAGAWKDSSQMGPVGSREYYEQMGRAWFGTIAFAAILPLFLGTGDDDDIEITGALAGQPDFGQSAANAKPKYSIRVGKFWFSYMNIPSIAVAMSVVGNANDRLNSGDKAEDVKEAFALGTMMVFNAVLMVRDMSFVDGISDLAGMVKDVATVNAEKSEKEKARYLEQMVKSFTKNYVSFAMRALPQNNNMIRQIYKAFDPASYSQKEIKDIINYSTGMMVFGKARANLDIFGETVKTYPGETMVPYTHWTGLKGKDPRWKFLLKYDAIPPKIQNDVMVTISGVDKRYLEEDEYRDLVKIAGAQFDSKLRQYMAIWNEETMAKKAKIKTGYLDYEESLAQKEINELWSKSKEFARDAVRKKYSQTEHFKERINLFYNRGK